MSKKVERHDAHVQLCEEQMRAGSPIMQAVLRGAEAALAKNPDSPYLKKCVEDQRALMNGTSESRDTATLYAGRPME